MKHNAEETEGLVVVCRVVAPHGTVGELVIESISDSPGRFSAGGILFLKGKQHKIERSFGLPKGRIGLKLTDIDDRISAVSLKGAELTINEAMVLPLPEGQYYHFQIMDLQVRTVGDEYLGQIMEILSPGNNDVYVVSNGEKEILIPAIDGVVVEVDLDNNTMTVDLPEGLQ